MQSIGLTNGLIVASVVEMLARFVKNTSDMYATFFQLTSLTVSLMK